MSIEMQPIEKPGNKPNASEERRLKMAARMGEVHRVYKTPKGELVDGMCRLTGQPVTRLIEPDGNVFEWEPTAWRWVYLDEGTSADYRHSLKLHPGAA